MSCIIMIRFTIIAAMHFVVAGYIQNKSAIITVSGEGAWDKIYIIVVMYIRCNPDIGIQVLVSFVSFGAQSLTYNQISNR